MSQAELDRRRRLGIDRWDEMWEGVLHMGQAPAFEHQRMHLEIGSFLLSMVKTRTRGTLASGVNVFNERSPLEDYRIPDFSFVGIGHEKVIAEDGIRGGGPDLVLEIRSPGDETYEKLPFFAKLAVREVVVIDRDSKRPEVFRLAGDRYLGISADPEGWLVSEVLGIRLRQAPGDLGSPPRLILEDREDPATRLEI